MRFDLSAWELTELIWRRRWRFALAAGIPIVAAVAFCAFTQPRYDASVSLIVAAGHSASLEPAADRVANLARQDRIVSAKVAILDSEIVIRNTIDDIGPGVLYPELDAKVLGALVEQVFKVGQPFFFRGLPVSEEEMVRRQDLADAAYIRARRSLRVESRPNSDIVRIVFGHVDPDLAARFANQHAASFIQRDLALGTMQSTTNFLRDQQEKHLDTLKQATASLSDFAKLNQIFAVDEQRRLTLRRHSELASARAASRSAAAEKQEQVRSLTAQLALMKPVPGSPEIARLASLSELSPTSHMTGAPPPAPKARDHDAASSEAPTRGPPLMLVRVYQDAIQGLVRANSELAGIRAIEASQAREIAATEAELVLLGEKEAEYVRLQTAVAQARENVEAYARKSAAQQVEADMSTRNLSSIIVAQPASRPIEPAFPNPMLILLLGGSSGFLLGLVSVLVPGRAERRVPRPMIEPTLVAPPARRREPFPLVAQIGNARRAGLPSEA